MATTIGRTPIYDDSGGGKDGTALDNAWKQQFYDQIDAALAGVGTTADLAIISNAQTGTINDWAPAGRTRHTWIEWAGTAAITIGGIAGGVAGDRVTFRNASPTAAAMVFQHAAASASAAINRLNNRVTSAGTPVGLAGTITYVHVGGGWVLSQHDQGAWLSAPFNAANFSGAGGMVWTVEAADRVDSRYRINGQALEYQVALGATTISGTAAGTLQINQAEFGGVRLAPPGGYQRWGYHNVTGDVMASGSDTVLALQLVGGGNFVVGTNAWYLYGAWRGPVL